MGLTNVILPYVIQTWDESPNSRFNLLKCLQLSDEEGWMLFIRSKNIEKKIMPALIEPDEEQGELWDLISQIATHKLGRMQLSEYLSRSHDFLFFLLRG